MSKRSKQMSLLGFLDKTKKLKESEKGDEINQPTEDVTEIVNENDKICEEPETVEVVKDCNLNDIGKCLNKEAVILDDNMKYELIKNVWVPECDYEFQPIGLRKLRFQYKWLNKFHWLAYSELYNGTFCKCCVFFSNNNIGKGSNVKTGKLVSEVFNNYKNALEFYRNHSELSYHKNSLLDMDNFVLRHEKKVKNIVEELDSAKAREFAANRLKLKPIVETILLCGRQGLALRGHRDAGPINIQKEPDHNDGNFRAILRFKANSGDVVLSNHFETMGANATYISPEIQNELINIIGALITKNIVDEVNLSCGFSVLADETTDVSHKEQLTLCVR